MKAHQPGAYPRQQFLRIAWHKHQTLQPGPSHLLPQPHSVILRTQKAKPRATNLVLQPVHDFFVPPHMLQVSHMTTFTGSSSSPSRRQRQSPSSYCYRSPGRSFTTGLRLASIGGQPVQPVLHTQQAAVEKSHPESPRSQGLLPNTADRRFVRSHCTT